MEMDNDSIVGTVWMTETINGESERLEGTLYGNHVVMWEDGMCRQVDDDTFAEMVSDIMRPRPRKPEPDIFEN